MPGEKGGKAEEAVAEPPAEAKKEEKAEKEAKKVGEEKGGSAVKDAKAAAPAGSEVKGEKGEAAKEESKEEKKKKGSKKKGEADKADKALRNVIVNHLAAGCTEDHLRALFSEFGTVESVKIVCNKETRMSMKYAFVVYEDPASVPKAIKSLNGRKDTASASLRVAYASAPGQPKGLEGKHETCFVGGIGTASKQQVNDRFSAFGTIMELKLMDPGNERYSKGVAFVKFTSVAEAESAIVNLNGKPLNPERPDERKMVVKYADRNRREPSHADAQLQAQQVQYQMMLMHQQQQQVQMQINQHQEWLRKHFNMSCVCTVTGIPHHFQAAQVWEYFGLGIVRHLEYPTDPMTGLGFGYAFVIYADEQFAYNAAQRWDNFPIGGGMLSVRTDAKWRPQAFLASDLEANLRQNPYPHA